jgi:hypothetical protein
MNRKESRLDREIQFHLDQHAADLIASGVDPVEARRQARIALGGPVQVKAICLIAASPARRASRMDPMKALPYGTPSVSEGSAKTD